MQDLIYAYHGLRPLLTAYNKMMKLLECSDTDPDHVWLIASLPMKLVCCV